MISKFIILLSILPLFYKLSFWTYVIQLKEYRWDRFKEYLSTKQGKKAIFNIFFIPEIFIFLIYLLTYLGYLSNNILLYGLIIILIIENLYISLKIAKKQIILPKKTGRTTLLLGIILIDLISEFIYFYSIDKIYFYIPFILLFIPLYVLGWNLILTPFINFKKKKLFKKASIKTKNLNLHKVGITGSFGKTSTKEYLSTILSSKYKVFKTPKNINTELGLANLVLKTDFSGYNVFIAEMGAYSKGEISQSGKIINHKDAFITGIGNQHIGLFGNQQNIIDGKFEIAKKVLENNGKLYVNDNIKIENNKIILDNKEYTLPKIVKKLLEKNKIIFYGLNNNQVVSKILNVNESGTEFEFYYKGKKYKLKTHLIGKAQIENLTGCLVYAIDNKIEDLQKAIENITQPKHTLNIIKKENTILIDDTYNLSVHSLFNAIDVVGYFKGEKILVLDDILELGKNAKQIHYEIGKKVSNIFDKIIFVGINYKESFEKGIKEQNGILIDTLPENIENTVILFEGKKARKLLNKCNNKVKLTVVAKS